MFDDHTIALERPRLGATKPYFQAVCACGWKAGPTYGLPYQQQVAEVHLAGVREKVLMAELEAAGERGETISVSAWREAHPLPPALPA